jgi:hypothetical protein
MQKRLISFGCWVAGILVVACVYLVALWAQNPWIVVGAIVLAALEARRIRVWRYQSDIARSPGTLFLLMLLFGWIVLPWFVGLRFKILAGTAEFKDEYRWREVPASARKESAPPSGLVQPWSVRWRQRFLNSAFGRPRAR